MLLSFQCEIQLSQHPMIRKLGERPIYEKQVFSFLRLSAPPDDRRVRVGRLRSNFIRGGAPASIIAAYRTCVIDD